MTIPNIYRAMKIKGINLIGTGDFTHPLWLKELKKQLKPCRRFSGILCYKDDGYFILQTEVSTVYSDKGKTRKVHHVILSPSFEIVEQINDVLSKYGNLKKDGRPTLNCSSAELVENVMEISKQNFIFPAHIWTPWFGVLGSKSGYDSLEEAYGKQVKYIHAFETGLSSDPKMNWAVSKLDKFTPISNSDAHSPENIGREANIFNLRKLSYEGIMNAIKTRKGLVKTLEFYPEEGKYYYDGHRKCNFSVSPEKHVSVCPVCKKKLTLGVLHRILKLADRKLGFVPKNAVPFMNIIPLKKVIAYVLSKGENTRAVSQMYDRIISYFGSELGVYLSNDLSILLSLNPRLAKIIKRIKEGRVAWNPGFDGKFGEIISH